jgi:hypothetical protein
LKFDILALAGYGRERGEANGRTKRKGEKKKVSREMTAKLTSTKATRSRQVLLRAVQAFPGSETTELTAEQGGPKELSAADAVVRLKHRDHRQTYHARIIINYENACLPQLCHQMAGTGGGQQLLLITSELSAGQAEALKQRGIEFIDTAGNAYIDAAGVYVFVSGKRCPNAIPRPKPASRLLQPRGLQVIFTCLAAVPKCHETGRPNPVLHLKTLAEMSGVSLGTASEIRNTLIEQGYLVMTEQGCEWQRLLKLFERWAGAYAERLYPKLLVQRYRSVMPALDTEAPLPENALWGGETAAARLLPHYVAPQVNAIYIVGEPGGFATRLGLIADPTGAVELRNMFWSPKLASRHSCVSPLLVYADLLASDQPRNIETAELIYERFIADDLETSDSRAL